MNANETSAHDTEQEYIKKYGMRRLHHGEVVICGDIGYVQPGAKPFTPRIGIKYDSFNMHPIYRPVTDCISCQNEAQAPCSADVYDLGCRARQAKRQEQD